MKNYRVFAFVVSAYLNIPLILVAMEHDGAGMLPPSIKFMEISDQTSYHFFDGDYAIDAVVMFDTAKTPDGTRISGMSIPGKLVGLATCRQKNPGWISSIKIEEDEQGKGYSNHLLFYLMQRAEKAGCKQLLGNVRRKMVSFFEKKGAKTVKDKYANTVVWYDQTNPPAAEKIRSGNALQLMYFDISGVHRVVDIIDKQEQFSDITTSANTAGLSQSTSSGLSHLSRLWSWLTK
jgi:GNAT superfamily N-acetyltransferase